MHIFISATKTVPTCPDCFFFAISPVNKYVTPWKLNIFFNFFFFFWSLVRLRKSHEVSGSYCNSFRNNLNLNLPRAKIAPRPPGLIGLMLVSSNTVFNCISFEVFHIFWLWVSSSLFLWILVRVQIWALAWVFFHGLCLFLSNHL